MSQKVNALIFTNDLKIAKDLQAATKSFSSEFTFYPCSSFEKFAEYGERFKLDAVVVDEIHYDPLKDSWVHKIRSSFSMPLGNDQVPFFLLAAEKDPSSVRRILSQGFEDILTKPVDIPMFFQKLQIYLPTVRFLRENLLFSLPVNVEADLAVQCTLVSASEYGVVMQTNLELAQGDVVTLYGPPFNGAETRSCLAKVMQSSALPGGAGGFQSTLVFVSPTKDALTSVRLWLKQEYIRSAEQA